MKFLQTFIYKDNSTLKLYKHYILYCSNSANIYFNSELRILAIYNKCTRFKTSFFIYFFQLGILRETKNISSEKAWFVHKAT